MKEWQPDIVFLQEVGVHFHPRLNKHNLENHLEALSDAFWPHTSYGQNASCTNGHHGNAILSRWPLTEVFNLNLTVSPIEKRGLQHVTIHIEGRKIHLLNTHLDVFYWTRKKQVQKLIEYINRTARTDCPVILAGDFNDWNSKTSLQIQKKSFLKEVSHTPIKTYPHIFPVLPLDRIFCYLFDVEKVFSIPTEKGLGASDHLALMTEFTFSDKPTNWPDS